MKTIHKVNVFGYEVEIQPSAMVLSLEKADNETVYIKEIFQNGCQSSTPFLTIKKIGVSADAFIAEFDRQVSNGEEDLDIFGKSITIQQKAFVVSFIIIDNKLVLRRVFQTKNLEEQTVDVFDINLQKFINEFTRQCWLTRKRLANGISTSIHYAQSGEWGGSKTNCHRYFTSDVNHTGIIDEVTCKWCLQSFKKKK
jgi:hypothetical protein